MKNSFSKDAKGIKRNIYSSVSRTGIFIVNYLKNQIQYMKFMWKTRLMSKINIISIS